MRSLPCPYCGKPVSFDWGDFLMTPHPGPPIFCLACRKTCTTDTPSGLVALSAGALFFFVPFYFLFVSDLTTMPKAVAGIICLPCGIIGMVVMAMMQARMARRLVPHPAFE